MIRGRPAGTRDAAHASAFFAAATQLDLFEHSALTVARNELRRALAAADPAAARGALATLREHAVAGAEIDDYAWLIDALQEDSPDGYTAVGAVERMCARTEPAAARRLGDQAGTYLRPLWLRLGRAISARPFDPRAPRCHASFALARAGAWEAVVAAVEAEADWTREPALVQRHAEALERLGRTRAALESWTRLCWRFPRAAAEALEASVSFARAWLAFCDLETDPTLATADFPAWLALYSATPGSVPTEAAGSEPAMVLDIVNALVARGGREPDDETLRLRARLKKLRPALLAVHLAAARPWRARVAY